jgi:hypothetical protein
VLVVESMIHFDVAHERRVKKLSQRDNPVKNRAFEALHIVRPRT